jgi:predicted dehydrogenase
MEAVVDLLAEGKMNPRALITHRIPIEDGVKAYEVIKGNSPEPSLGVLLTYPLLEAKSSTREKTIALEPSHQGSGAIAIGLVGAGKFAKGVLMPFIKCDSRVQLIGLCSRTGKSARLSGDKFGFQYCSTDWNRIIGDNQVNTVVITTRHHLHAEQVSAALRAGKHVFVEKPLCVNSTELDAVSEAYRAASERNPAPLLMIDFNRRFASMSLAIKKFMAAVSEPLLIHYRINGGRIPLEHWTQDPAQGGGRLVGEMVHFIDWAIWLANDPPMSVYAVCLPNLGTYNDDNVALTIRFLNGTVAQITYLANGSRAIGKERIEVHGGGKSIILDDFGLLELADESGCHRKRALLKRDKGHGTAWKRFADAIQRGDEAPIAFDQIHTTMRTAFAALQSIREKRELSLEHIG